METSIAERRAGLAIAVLLLALQVPLVLGAARSETGWSGRVVLLGLAVLAIVVEGLVVAMRWRVGSPLVPYASTFVGLVVVAGLCLPLMLGW